MTVWGECICICMAESLGPTNYHKVVNQLYPKTEQKCI